MNSAQHTPGPWQFYADLPSTEPNWHIVTNASRQRVIANVHIEPDNAMDKANARLIAAAPDLLEALRPIAAAYPDDPGTSDLYDEQPVTITLGDVRKVWAALAKAR